MRGLHQNAMTLGVGERKGHLLSGMNIATDGTGHDLKVHIATRL